MLRCITFTVEHQQPINPGRGKGGLPGLAEYHRQHRSVAARQLVGQPQQIAVVAAQAAPDHIRHHGDIKRRGRDLMQR